MKKIVIFSCLAALLLVSAIAFADADPEIPIYRWQGTPTTVWTEITNNILADATAANTWSTSAYASSVQLPDGLYYVVLPATPNWLKLPRIDFTLFVSQWIFINIQYMDYTMHVDIPGDYTVDTLSFHVKTNGGVFAYFRTGGWLTDVSSATNKIPTWAGWRVNSGALPTVGLPANGVSTGPNFWYDFDALNTLTGPTPATRVLLPFPTGEDTYHVWLGFRVGAGGEGQLLTRKGKYVTWADIYLQSDP